MDYYDLLNEIEANDIEIVEDNLPGTLKGLYIENTIWIDKSLDQRTKKCVLAEELGHHMVNAGDITDQRIGNNRREEKKAHAKAYETLVTLEDLIRAFEAGCANSYEIAEHLDVTEEFLLNALTYYQTKHGLECSVGKSYCVRFEPFSIIKRRQGSAKCPKA